VAPCPLGPLVPTAHRATVTSYLEAGLKAGATLVVDGREHPVDSVEQSGVDTSGGFWLGPAVSVAMDEAGVERYVETLGEILAELTALQ